MNARKRPSSRSAFTLMEMLAVLALMVAVFGFATGAFSRKSTRLRAGAYQLSQDIQSLYFVAIRKAKVHRITFESDRETYLLEEYQPPLKKPNSENKKAMEAWEAERKAIEELSATERSARTRIDRGSFKVLKKSELPRSIQVKSFFNANRTEESSNSKKPEEEKFHLLIYPSGEMDQSLIVLNDGGDQYFSLEIQPLTGKVRASPREVTEEEWKKDNEGK